MQAFMKLLCLIWLAETTQKVSGKCFDAQECWNQCKERGKWVCARGDSGLETMEKCQATCEKYEIAHRGYCTPEEEDRDAKDARLDSRMFSIMECESRNGCNYNSPRTTFCARTDNTRKGQCEYETTTEDECMAKCNGRHKVHDGECTKKELQKPKE